MKFTIDNVQYRLRFRHANVEAPAHTDAQKQEQAELKKVRRKAKTTAEIVRVLPADKREIALGEAYLKQREYECRVAGHDAECIYVVAAKDRLSDAKTERTVTIAKGEAFCSKHDQFVKETGRKLALQRLLDGMYKAGNLYLLARFILVLTPEGQGLIRAGKIDGSVDGSINVKAA
jgi:hypothetical protein